MLVHCPPPSSFGLFDHSIAHLVKCTQLCCVREVPTILHFLLLTSVYCLCKLCWQVRRLCSLSPVRWWRRLNARIAWRHWTNTLTRFRSHSALEKSSQDSLMPLSSATLELPYWSHCLRWHAPMSCYMAWDRGHCILFPIPNLPPKFGLGGIWIRYWNGSVQSQMLLR